MLSVSYSINGSQAGDPPGPMGEHFAMRLCIRIAPARNRELDVCPPCASSNSWAGDPPGPISIALCHSRHVPPRDRVLSVPALLVRYPVSGLPRDNALPSRP